MTYAWTLGLTLNPLTRKPEFNDYTGDYVIALLMQLTNKQQLYAEIRWRDPI